MIRESGIWDEVEKLRGGLEDLFKAGLGYSGRGPASRVMRSRMNSWSWWSWPASPRRPSS